MKSIDIFCASPGSTAICSSMDHRALVRHGVIKRPLDRLDEKPKKSAPCSSHLPFEPARRRSLHHNTSGKRAEFYRRKSSADVDDLASPRSSFLEVVSESSHLLKKTIDIDTYRDTITTTTTNNNKRLNSSRFVSTRSTTYSTMTDEYPVYKPSTHDALSRMKSSSTTRRVVELRVSIHCKGCEGKLRKYISRMEGVTSFSIDLATKKVTVIGDVNPAGVLTSISKVKNAQFWPSPLTSSSSSSTSSSSTLASI